MSVITMKPAPWNMWCMARDLSLPCIKYWGKKINNEIENMAAIDFRGEKKENLCLRMSVEANKGLKWLHYKTQNEKFV